MIGSWMGKIFDKENSYISLLDIEQKSDLFRGQQSLQLSRASFRLFSWGPQRDILRTR